MEQEGNQSLVEFWLAAINFEQHLKDKKNYDPIEAQNDAIVLYDKLVLSGEKLASLFFDTLIFSINIYIHIYIYNYFISLSLCIFIHIYSKN